VNNLSEKVTFLDYCLYQVISKKEGDKWEYVEARGPLDTIRLPFRIAQAMDESDEGRMNSAFEEIRDLLLSMRPDLVKSGITISFRKNISITKNDIDMDVCLFEICSSSGKPLIAIDPRQYHYKHGAK